jgi:DNA-directed RNA polymerase I subunit RPA1
MAEMLADLECAKSGRTPSHDVKSWQAKIFIGIAQASSTSSGASAMNISHSLPSTVSGISFSFLTSEDVRRISVKQIVNPVLLDDLNRPNIGGLYDPALGPAERSDMCATTI